MDKTDLKKDLEAYHARPREFRMVEVPELQYLMIDGHGDPNTSSAFTRAVEALYPVAYKLKFASKKELGRDYVVMPYDDEAELLAQMHHDFIPASGLTMIGKHHEIYLSDARKVAPGKLRTIRRQPVRAAAMLP